MLDSGAQPSDSVIHFFDHSLQRSPFILPPTNPLILNCCTFLLSLGSFVPVYNYLHACMLCAQSYQVLRDPCSLPCTSVHGILQARILECVTIPFSRESPNPEIKPRSPALQADSLPAELPGIFDLHFRQ